MKCNRILFLLVVVGLLFTVACGNKDGKAAKNHIGDKEALANLTDQALPIVKDKIELDMFVAHPSGASDWNDIMIWNKYEEMTNIAVNFEQIPADSLEEKRNLTLASRKLPDAFYSADLPPLDLLKYGEQGTLLKLNDLIDEYAPNVKKLFEDYPDVKKALTFPDGNIYSLPGFYSPEFLSLIVGSRPWVNQEWLDELGMKNPETIDEYYEFLKAVQEQDPAGDGKTVAYGGRDLDGLIQWLRGSYGIANTGRDYIDKDPDADGVRFYPVTDTYKEMLQFMNKLYREGLIEQNIFSIDQSQYLANAAEGVYASTVFWSPEDLFGAAGKAFVGGLALEGPHGDRNYSSINHPAYNIGKFAMTNQNKNPEATMKWIDYFYSDEGSRFVFMGIEGETYEVNDAGEYVYMDHIRNSKEGLTLDQEIAKYLTWVGGIPAILKEDYFQGSEKSPSSIEAANGLEPHMIDEIWPSFTYTFDENKKLTALEADIHKYADEMQDKFISGDESFDNWDNYVKAIENMGLKDYLKIQDQAFKRYEKK